MGIARFVVRFDVALGRSFPDAVSRGSGLTNVKPAGPRRPSFGGVRF